MGRDEFKEFMEYLLEIMFDAAEEAAEEAGHPVNGVSAMENALLEAGILTQEQIEGHPCFQCVSRTPIMIDADGSIVDDEEVK